MRIFESTRGRHRLFWSFEKARLNRVHSRRVCRQLFPPAVNQIYRGAWPVRERKLKTRFQQARWHDAAAFQKQFCFSAQEECANFEHPFWSWEAKPSAMGLAKGAHEIPVWQRMGRANVDRALQTIICDKDVNCTNKV